MLDKHLQKSRVETTVSQYLSEQNTFRMTWSIQQKEKHVESVIQLKSVTAVRR